MDHKSDESEAATSSATFVSHDRNIDDFASIFEIILNILLLCRVQNASDEKLDVNWIAHGLGLSLFHRLPELKLLLRRLWRRRHISGHDLRLAQSFTNCLNRSIGFICHILSQWPTVFQLLLQLGQQCYKL